MSLVKLRWEISLSVTANPSAFNVSPSSVRARSLIISPFPPNNGHCLPLGHFSGWGERGEGIIWLSGGWQGAGGGERDHTQCKIPKKVPGGDVFSGMSVCLRPGCPVHLSLNSARNCCAALFDQLCIMLTDYTQLITNWNDKQESGVGAYSVMHPQAVCRSSVQDLREAGKQCNNPTR